MRRNVSSLDLHPFVAYTFLVLLVPGTGVRKPNIPSVLSYRPIATDPDVADIVATLDRGSVTYLAVLVCDHKRQAGWGGAGSLHFG